MNARPKGTLDTSRMKQILETIDNLVIRQDKREITEIIVHSSATPEGTHWTVEDLDRWHRRRNFRCIGYHYVVYLDGSIHPGRPVEEMGAHCKAGKHNYHSIGVCYIGGTEKDGKTPKDTRTPEQKEALRALLGMLKAAYRMPKSTDIVTSWPPIVRRSMPARSMRIFLILTSKRRSHEAHLAIDSVFVPHARQSKQASLHSLNRNFPTRPPHNKVGYQGSVYPCALPIYRLWVKP